MRNSRRTGFSLIEVLAVMVVAGLTLGGKSRLVESAARYGGEGEWRMKARLSAIGALECGVGRPSKGPLRVEVETHGAKRVARASWPGGSLRLESWTGHE